MCACGVFFFLSFRWAFYPTGDIVYKAGKKVLEVAVIDSDGQLTLPQVLCDTGVTQHLPSLVYPLSPDLMAIYFVYCVIGFVLHSLMSFVCV